ncbi:MAG: zinc-ribbon domain-containing protein [Candidatus Eisenbacteria bacterium]
MKLDCATCGARYSIDESIIPPQGAKIRCRKCGGVIAVPPRVEPAPVSTTLVPPSPQQHQPPQQPVAPPAAPQPSTTASAFSFFSSNAAPATSTPLAPLAPAPAPAAPQARAAAPPPAAPPPPQQRQQPPPPSAAVAQASSSAVASALPVVATPVPEGLSPEERTRHEKARRLARVLASDIAIYNREKKERGLSDGNLVAVLGYEIKKSWEIYKERVGADFANATPYFRDALNDLLADGKKIF